MTAWISAFEPAQHLDKPSEFGREREPVKWRGLDKILPTQTLLDTRLVTPGQVPPPAEVFARVRAERSAAALQHLIAFRFGRELTAMRVEAKDGGRPPMTQLRWAAERGIDRAHLNAMLCGHQTPHMIHLGHLAAFEPGLLPDGHRVDEVAFPRPPRGPRPPTSGAHRSRGWEDPADRDRIGVPNRSDDGSVPPRDPAHAAEMTERLRALARAWLDQHLDTTSRDGAPSIPTDITVAAGADRSPDAAGFLLPEHGRLDVTVAADWPETVGSWCEELPGHLILEVARRDTASRPALVFAARVIDYLGSPRIVSSPATVSWHTDQSAELTWCNNDPELYDEPYMPSQ